MQHFIDSADNFIKLIGIGEKLDAGRRFCSNSYVDFPEHYSIKDDIVYFCYTCICELILVDNNSGRNAAITVRDYDIDFLNNLLGDFLDESYFTAGFIGDFINGKLRDYSRVLILEAPYFMYLCRAYDGNRRSNFFSQLCTSVNAIDAAYRNGRISEKLISADSDMFFKSCDKQFAPFSSSLGDVFQGDLSGAQNSYEATYPEIAEFFRYDTISLTETANASSAFGTRGNPVPLGTAGRVAESGNDILTYEADVTIEQVTRGENIDAAILETTLEYDDKPECNQEYLEAKIHINAHKTGAIGIHAWMMNFSLVGQNGQLYEPTCCEPSPPLQDMYSGTAQTAWLLFVTDKTDKPLIRFNLTDNELWFCTD